MMVEYILKNGKKIILRHGEIGFTPIKKLPDDLIETKTNLIMKGSHNNDHTFTNGHLYLKNINQFIFGYFASDKDCTILYHVEHGEEIGKKLREAKLPKKYKFYELRKQHEDTNKGMKPVVD